MKIYSTTDYGQFKRLVGNRKINKTHVSKLVKSISRENHLEQYPGIVSPELFVYDGQHRLAAAEILQVPFFYQIEESLSLDMIRNLQLFKSWSMEDYLDSFIEQGNPHYIKLKEFMKLSGFGVSISGMLIGDQSRNAATTKAFFHGSNSLFKQGAFEASRLATGMRVLGLVEDVTPYLEVKSIRIDRDFLAALLKLDYLVEQGLLDWKRMLYQFEAAKKKIQREYTIRDYLRALEDIFNFNMKTKFRFY